MPEIIPETSPQALPHISQGGKAASGGETTQEGCTFNSDIKVGTKLIRQGNELRIGSPEGRIITQKESKFGGHIESEGPVIQGNKMVA